MMDFTERMLQIRRTVLANQLAQAASSADDRVSAQALAATGKRSNGARAVPHGRTGCTPPGSSETAAGHL